VQLGSALPSSLGNCGLGIAPEMCGLSTGEQCCSDWEAVHLSLSGLPSAFAMAMNIPVWIQETEPPMLGTILIVLLILALLGVLPRWTHSSNWGYYPTGGVGLILFVVVILLLLGRI
jgi:hypothetical protein